MHKWMHESTVLSLLRTIKGAVAIPYYKLICLTWRGCWMLDIKTSVLSFRTNNSSPPPVAPSTAAAWGWELVLHARVSEPLASHPISVMKDKTYRCQVKKYLCSSQLPLFWEKETSLFSSSARYCLSEWRRVWGRKGEKGEELGELLTVFAVAYWLLEVHVKGPFTFQIR